MSERRVFTQELSGSALTRAALEGRLPAHWYSQPPRTVSEWTKHASAVCQTGKPNWTRDLLPAIAPSGAAADRLAKSAGGSGMVVTTGQQAGLFGGPIYTWAKALSALALADALEMATGIPVAPVFWAATDDADFAEASTTHVAVPGGVETLSLHVDRSQYDGEAMRDVPLGNVSELLHGLERGAGSVAYAEALEAARASYMAGATVGIAYVTLLRRVLEPLGICVLDAGHPAVQAASLPLLLKALDRAAELESALKEREREIRETGFEPQVTTVDGLSLVFGRLDGGRRRIPIVHVRDATSAATKTDRLGPNVLLRPVVERMVLPTAAYVAGPGEVAYFAQVSAVAAVLKQTPPLAIPRWSGMIVPAHIGRILARYRIVADDLRDAHAIETRLARALMPERFRQALDQFRTYTDESSRDVAGALRAISPPILPETALEGTRLEILRRLDRLERRATAAIKRRETEMIQDIATARGVVYPFGHQQERVLNFIPFLARYGTALLREMVGCASDHAANVVGIESPTSTLAASAGRSGSATSQTSGRSGLD
ncbi:MAG: bacillithiol biosynthesis cysteine-adding enzyme BshC [Gemmatimonadaceae bacterium]